MVTQVGRGERGRASLTHLRFRPRSVLENVTPAAGTWPAIYRKAGSGRSSARRGGSSRSCAYIRAGSVAAAAYDLGIGETTVRPHLSGLYRRTGCVNAAQAAYPLGARQLDVDPTPRAASRE